MLFKTSPLDIIDKQAEATHYGGFRTFPPRFIYLHGTGGVDSLEWLTSTSNPPVSCHRLILQDGRIYKLVDDLDTAWTQGGGVVGMHGPNRRVTCNTDGLSIELEHRQDGKEPYTLAQLGSCAAQVCEWQGLYGLIPVLGHYDVDRNKRDPLGFPWGLFWRILLAKYVVALGSSDTF